MRSITVLSISIATIGVLVCLFLVVTNNMKQSHNNGLRLSSTRNLRLLDIDPKTIYNKIETYNNNDNLLHPSFSFDPSKSISRNDLQIVLNEMKHEQLVRNNNQTISVLSFGTSMTWGTGLEIFDDIINDNNRQQYTYSGLLAGSDATNLALRAQGPHYPAMCTQSMLKNSGEDEEDKIYDVITLEFFFGAKPTLQFLTKRLRERYPKAIIILLRLWRLGDAWHYSSNPQTGQYISLENWLQLNGINDNIYSTSTSFLQFIEKVTTTTTPDNWFYIDNNKATRESVEIQSEIYEEMKNDNVYLLDVMPERTNFHNVIHLYGGMFLPDLKHWSIKGHMFVATRIQQLLNNIQYVSPTTSTVVPATLSSSGGQQEEDSSTSSKTTDEPLLIRPWTTEDYCSTWLSKPIIPESLVPKYEGMQLNSWSEQKYSLQLPTIYELSSKQPQPYSFMEIHNPFNERMNVLISFMASGIEYRYYQTDTWLVNTLPSGEDPLSSLPSSSKKVRLNPYLTDTNNGFDIHIVVTTHVGIIEPGSTEYVIFSPDKNQHRPPGMDIQGLRIVGVVVSDLQLQMTHMQMTTHQVQLQEEATTSTSTTSTIHQ